MGVVEDPRLGLNLQFWCTGRLGDTGSVSFGPFTQYFPLNLPTWQSGDFIDEYNPSRQPFVSYNLWPNPFFNGCWSKFRFSSSGNLFKGYICAREFQVISVDWQPRKKKESQLSTDFDRDVLNQKKTNVFRNLHFDSNHCGIGDIFMAEQERFQFSRRHLEAHHLYQFLQLYQKP